MNGVYLNRKSREFSKSFDVGLNILMKIESLQKTREKLGSEAVNLMLG